MDPQPQLEVALRSSRQRACDTESPAVYKLRDHLPLCSSLVGIDVTTELGMDDHSGRLLLSRPLDVKNDIVRAGELAPEKLARIDYRRPIIRIAAPERV